MQKDPKHKPVHRRTVKSKSRFDRKKHSAGHAVAKAVVSPGAAQGSGEDAAAVGSAGGGASGSVVGSAASNGQGVVRGGLLDGNMPGIPISRRSFLIGALGVAAAAAVGGTAVAATQCAGSHVEEGASTKVGDLSVLNVSNEAVFTAEDCEYLDPFEGSFSLKASKSLPYGTMVWASDDQVAACLLPCETSTPLAQVGLLTLEDGNMATVLESAVAQNEGFEIYDVRANSQGMVWTEANILNGKWRIYTAELADNALGDAAVAFEGNSEWETPALAVSGSYAFWQMIPKKTENTSELTSQLMKARFGSDASEVVYEAQGRMACDPASSGTGIAIAPRANASGTYYQLTHIDAETNEVTDTLVLPASMKPTYNAYGKTGFSFAFDGIYTYGGGISNLGTYTPCAGLPYDLKSATVDAIKTEEAKLKEGKVLSESAKEEAGNRAVQTVADLYSSTDWFRFTRTPYTTPAWCGDWFVVKSTSVVAAVNLANRSYFTLEPETATQGYGEFLASSGNVERFVTFSNVNYTPLKGQPIVECKVRIWEQAAEA